jgi:hypothetical protein
MNLFIASNTEFGLPGLFAVFSTDGGATWTDTDATDGVIAEGDVGDSLPSATFDPSVRVRCLWQPLLVRNYSRFPVW